MALVVDKYSSRRSLRLWERFSQAPEKVIQMAEHKTTAAHARARNEIAMVPDWMMFAIHADEKYIKQLEAGMARLENFSPTAEQINALPLALRDYIHDIVTRCDPAGDVEARVLAEDTARALEAENDKLKNRLMEFGCATCGDPRGIHGFCDTVCRDAY